MGKHAIQKQENVRPRRRDLRAASYTRVAADVNAAVDCADISALSEDDLSSAAASCPSRDSAKGFQQVSAALTDTGETAVIDIATIATFKNRAQEENEVFHSRGVRAFGAPDKWSDMFRSALHCGNNKRAWAGVGAGAAVVALIVGSMGINQAAQAQAVAHRSVLNSSLMQRASESHSSQGLAPNKEAQAKAKEEARVEAAKSIASDPRAVCRGWDSGASSVASAYKPEDFSLVYYPMQQDQYTISSPFGIRTSPLTGATEMHTGADFAGDAGDPIYAIADGVVLTTTYSGEDNGIVIEHRANGKVFTSWYAHAYADDVLVSEGQEVKAGQKIALRGSSGHSTGPHLHFELHWGAGMKTEAVDPLIALKELGALDIAQDCKIS